MAKTYRSRFKKHVPKWLYKGFTIIESRPGKFDVIDMYGTVKSVAGSRESAKADIDRIANEKMRRTNPYKHKQNPPIEIYSRIKEIIAVKGPGHKCDAACKRAGHTYRHAFKQKAGVYGNPDGSLTVK